MGCRGGICSSYDVIIETQGLLKSALVCSLANKGSEAIVAGLANATEYSGYEPIARIFYNQCVQVPFQCHAVDRSRYVTCSALNWSLISREEQAQFYPVNFTRELAPHPELPLKTPYVVFFHSTARVAKRWSNQNWVILGKALSDQGYQVVLPWGNVAERAISDELAAQIPNSIVPKAFSIEEAFLVIAGATLVVGVDTGLSHLSAVLNKPTIEIYCDSPRWKTEGYWSDAIYNLGDIQLPPSAEEVIAVTNEIINVVER